MDFGGARLVLTSKSDSWRFFASDGRVLFVGIGIRFERLLTAFSSNLLTNFVSSNLLIVPRDL